LVTDLSIFEFGDTTGDWCY